ncbi:hypothetical protein IU454_07875 [Nocardia farcinica]|uniref:hypothetical protein n=1 Tax=Nocardia farcinica TaxID=37329 RepID=UPI001895B866|nr:hypothetical protein [Nocardia farcinica]MBF6291781.1 hypothetical protein [Nocardia farcinica]
MMDLARLRALWAEDDAAKMALARDDGPRGWLVDAESAVSVLVDCGGDILALPLDM